MIAETRIRSSTGESKILKQRAFTKLGLLLALFVGVGVATLLIIRDGSFVASLPAWFDTNHWLISAIRVGVFLTAISTFYLVRLHSIQSKNRADSVAERVRLKVRIQQLFLWFVSFELLFGQALLPRLLEFFFT